VEKKGKSLALDKSCGVTGVATGLITTAAPVPDKGRVVVPAVIFEVMITEAACTPVAVGVKITEIVQVALTATLAPQVVVSEYWLGFTPPKAIEVMFKVAVPELVNVDTMAVEEFPMVVAAKVSEVGFNVIAGTPVTVPE
jgi:hypothetical protein